MVVNRKRKRKRQKRSYKKRCKLKYCPINKLNGTNGHTICSSLNYPSFKVKETAGIIVNLNFNLNLNLSYASSPHASFVAFAFKCRKDEVSAQDASKFCQVLDGTYKADTTCIKCGVPVVYKDCDNCEDYKHVVIYLYDTKPLEADTLANRSKIVEWRLAFAKGNILATEFYPRPHFTHRFPKVLACRICQQKMIQ